MIVKIIYSVFLILINFLIYKFTLKSFFFSKVLLLVFLISILFFNKFFYEFLGLENILPKKIIVITTFLSCLFLIFEYIEALFFKRLNSNFLKTFKIGISENNYFFYLFFVVGISIVIFQMLLIWSNLGNEVSK